jgi:soluble lytic murein transglycosylase
MTPRANVPSSRPNRKLSGRSPLGFDRRKPFSNRGISNFPRRGLDRPPLWCKAIPLELTFYFLPMASPLFIGRLLPLGCQSAAFVTGRVSSKIVLALALALLTPSLAQPAGPSGDVPEDRAAQRALFQMARAALKAGRLGEYGRLKGKLVDYPLYPYLEYQGLQRTLVTVPPRRIEQFLERYSDSPLASQLRRSWLRQLARSERWTELLDFYRPSGSTAERCLSLQAMLHTGQRRAALDQVEEIWLAGRSQPKECDPVFRAWRGAGRLTALLVWERIALAMESGEPRLARHLERFLGPQDQTWAQLWRAVRKNPGRILTDLRLRSPHPYRTRIMAYGIQRIADRDSEKALRIWRDLQSRLQFTPEEKGDVERKIGIELILQDVPGALRRLKELPAAVDYQPVREWRVRAALRSQDWRAALKAIEALPRQEQQEEVWRYWRGRALESLDRIDESRAIYGPLAMERTYYGFLASDRLGRPYCMFEMPAPAGPDELERIEATPGVRRAHELFLLGELPEARREWQRSMESRDESELTAAAKLAQRWGWHDRAIFTLARAEYWDDLAARFPLAHRTDVEAQSRAKALDPAWVFAVLRQESAFMADARSGAGALGLMQLMPRTAQALAKNAPMPAKDRKRLLDPSVNIRLGAAYLRKVLDDLGQHPVLATAAYNAGPHRVRSWLPQSGPIPADIWVETVPFVETRAYVRRVLAYTVFYDQRLGKKAPTPLSRRMEPIGSRDALAANEDRSNSQPRG